jgi:hypothetical protein
VKRTDDAVLADRATDGDVGAQVRAVCVEHVWSSGGAAVADQPPAEVVQTEHLVRIDVAAVGDLEPALGVGVERESLFDVTDHSVTARLER